MNYKAWVTKAAKQPMVLETVELGRSGPRRRCSTLLHGTMSRRIPEHFPMSNINEAFARLGSGKARYRIVLDADF
jgi:hypothetical protein